MTTETLVGGVPVSELKEMLKTAGDDQLATFLHGYAMGFAADQFIAGMTRPNERVGFFVAMLNTYPEDWEKAFGMLLDGLPKEALLKTLELIKVRLSK